MRKVEEIGQKSKRKGYLQGTKLWKWRNFITGGVILWAVAYDFGFIYYYHKQAEKKRLEKGVPDMTQLERIKARLDEVREETNKSSQSKNKIPADVQDVLNSLNQGK